MAWASPLAATSGGTAPLLRPGGSAAADVLILARLFQGNRHGVIFSLFFTGT